MNGLVPYLSMIPVAALIFQAGKQSEKLDELFTKAYAQETEIKSTSSILQDIHIKVCIVEKDVKNMQEILIGRAK